MDSFAHQRLKPLVSFILPHLGRDKLLIETVRSITAQDVHADQVEVIIVSQADKSIRGQLQLELNQLNCSCPLKILSIPEGENISLARNFGASYATGNYLAFVDSDIRLSANWIKTMIEKLSIPEYILTSAVQIPDQGCAPNDVIRSGMSEANLGDQNKALPGANLFLKRSDFIRSDKFPEHLQTCEDSVFTNSLLTNGKLLLTDDSGFVHLGEDLTLSSLFKKEIWRGKSNIAAMHGRNIALEELPSLVFPLSVLLGSILVPVAIGVSSYSMVFLSVCLLLIPPILYSIRLKMRSTIKLSLIYFIQFFLVYFVARGIGMVKVCFEAKKSNPP